MELINAEEARKAEEAAYVLLMEEREELEEAREWDEYLLELEIYDFDEELEELNGDIERLLEANETNIPQSQIDTNIEKISEFREEYFAILDNRGLKETDLDDLIDSHNRERADEAAYDERAAKASAEKEEWNNEYQQAIADYQEINSRIIEIQGNISLYEERQAEEEWDSPEWQKFQMFLDLYYKQETNAYDELYDTVEPHYYEMQYQKEIREEQEKAQLAQEAIQRELDENVTKLATYQALAASLETEVEEAWAAYEAEDDADIYEGLYEVWEELTMEFADAEWEAQEISWLFEDIEAELAWEAEVARQKKMEEQKNQAYNDAMWAGDMYWEFIVDLEDRV
jgi:hypothetical protein